MVLEAPENTAPTYLAQVQWLLADGNDPQEVLAAMYMGQIPGYSGSSEMGFGADDLKALKMFDKLSEAADQMVDDLNSTDANTNVARNSNYKSAAQNLEGAGYGTNNPKGPDIVVDGGIQAEKISGGFNQSAGWDRGTANEFSADVRRVDNKIQSSVRIDVARDAQEMLEDPNLDPKDREKIQEAMDKIAEDPSKYRLPEDEFGKKEATPEPPTQVASLPTPS